LIRRWRYVRGERAAGECGIDSRTWRRVDHGQIRSAITHMSAGIDGTIYVSTQDRIFAISPDKRRRAAAH